jgi:hypothetical protein
MEGQLDDTARSVYGYPNRDVFLVVDSPESASPVILSLYHCWSLMNVVIIHTTIYSRPVGMVGQLSRTDFVVAVRAVTLVLHTFNETSDQFVLSYI